MTDFVDPTVIAQINGAKDELVAEVAKITQNSDTIQEYVDNLPDTTVGEAPSDGKTYGRKDKTWVEVTTGGGGSGEAVWGGITGNLSDQTDLQDALDAKADQSALADKANTADLAAVATSGKYNDLSGKPTILPDAPADGEQYARINNAWAKVEAELAANPTLQGKLTLQEANKDFVIEQDSSYVYFSRLGVFDGTYDFRFRVGNTGLEFSTNDNGNTWTPVGGGGESEPTNLGNTSTSTSVTITSSTGNNTTVSGASSFSAGVMTAADKSKLDGLKDFNGTYTGDLTIRTNTDNYTVLKPTSGSSNQFITKFQAWGKYNNPFGDAEHQYDVTFKKDGVYHQNVKGNGSERRLAFADELGGGATPTNLGATYATTTVTVTNDNGTNATLNAATTSRAGVMTSSDKSKLNGIASGAQVNTINTVFGRTGAVVAKDGDYTASQVDVTATPTNYTAASANVEAHLAGIDSALASAGGGGGGTQRILTYALNASLSSYTPLEDDSGVALSSPTILASLVGSDPDAVLSYWNTNFPDVKMFKICGLRGNTNMPTSPVAAYWDMTICRNTQSTNEVMVYHVKPVAIFDSIDATLVGKEYSRTFRSGSAKFVGDWVEV